MTPSWQPSKILHKAWIYPHVQLFILLWQFNLETNAYVQEIRIINNCKGLLVKQKRNFSSVNKMMLYLLNNQILIIEIYISFVYKVKWHICTHFYIPACRSYQYEYVYWKQIDTEHIQNCVWNKFNLTRGLNFYALLFKLNKTVIVLKHSYIDGLAQDCNNSIANALELLQSSAKPSI